MLHYPPYKSNIFFKDNYIIIGSTCFAQYPITNIEDDTSFIAIEGEIYNIDDDLIKQFLIDIANSLHRGLGYKDDILNFITKADGEFIVLIYNKLSHKLCAFNDLLGRLPFYYYQNEKVLALSREIKFAYPFIRTLTFDKTGVIEYLLYGFELGERTLIQGLGRLLPACIVCYQSGMVEFSKEQVSPLNLEPDISSDARKNSQESIQILKENFLTGLMNRTQKLRLKMPVIALSGGLDSRTTLAGLMTCKIAPKGITRNGTLAEEQELRYTRKIAELFGIPLIELFPTDEDNNEDYIRFVSLFDAALVGSLKTMVNIGEQICRREGPDIVYYTGLYGGEMFRYLNPTSGFSSDDDLVEYLFTTPDTFLYNPQKVSAMLQISTREMREHIKDHISTYLERDPYSKYLHFKFEYDYRWAGVGEDKNRLFYWTVTPFYSKEFFFRSYAIEEQKKSTLFFRNFMLAIDPKTCSVGYYNNGMSLSSPVMLSILGIAERAVRNTKIRQLTWQMINLKSRFVPSCQPDPKNEKYRAMALDLLEKSNIIRGIVSFQPLTPIM